MTATPQEKELRDKRMGFITHPLHAADTCARAWGRLRSQRSAQESKFSTGWQLSQSIENYHGCYPGQQ